MTGRMTRRRTASVVAAMGLGIAFAVLPAQAAHADTDYCNDVVGGSVESTLAAQGAVAAFNQMSDEYYTQALEDLPAHYLTCPAVTALINAGAQQVVLKAHPAPWWRFFWRW